MEIKNIYGAVVWKDECETVKESLEKAVEAKTELAYASLDGASLVGASLDGARLVGASLAYASLDGARLDGARLDGASLAYASLVGARLDGASLVGARLDGASLVGASLVGARLDGASLVGASLVGARLDGYPIVPHLDASILAAIKAGGKLNMSDWHSCETTHCRGGWAVTLAGKEGKELETRVGVSDAAALIYAASRPGKPIPDFYATNEDAMEDIKRGAAADPLPV